MVDLRLFEKHKNILSQVGPDFYREHWGQHHIDLRPRDLIRWIELCRDDLGYLTLVDIAGVDRRTLKSRWQTDFEVVYLLFDMGTHQRINLHVHLNSGEILPSVLSYYAYADWMEREQAELFELKFQRPMQNLIFCDTQKVPHVSGRFPKLRSNPNKSEPPYPEESWSWKNFDILSKETMGNFELQACFDPVRVVDTHVNIGFHHRGWEKLLEGKSPSHILYLLDLLQTGLAPTWSTVWAQTLEEMLGIKLPERAQAVRIVLLEMARVAEHLTVLYEMTASLAKEEAILFLDVREKILELFEKYCGHRQGVGVIRLGGMREDLPHGWIAEYQSIATLVQKALKAIKNSLLGQPDFRHHLDVGGVNAQTILQWGVGGPAMRAAGLNFDLRKSRPFYFYPDIDFDVPVGIHGTSYDRYLIRFEEIFQSLRIITQVIDNLPMGEVVSAELAEEKFDYGSLLKQLSNSWHYSALESPNGEAGTLFLCGPEAVPCRIKIKSPSFTMGQALKEFVRGLNQNQLGAAVASLGIRKSELDR